MGDLVEPGATSPILGSWDHPLVDPNLEDARITHSLEGLAGRLAGVPGAELAETAYRQKLRLKDEFLGLKARLN